MTLSYEVFPVCIKMFQSAICLLSAIPGAPVSVRLIGISEDSITIEWSPPSTDGGRPITRYVIEKREPQSQFWVPVSNVSSRTTVYQVQNLAPNSSYYFRVAAENEEGVGFYREFIEPVRPMKPKSKSLALTMTLMFTIDTF